MKNKTRTAFGVFLAIALIAVGAVIAKPESIPVGPGPQYLISFDPGIPVSDYTVHVMPTVRSETLQGYKSISYLLWINVSDYKICTIKITKYSAPLQPGQLANLVYHACDGSTETHSVPIVQPRLIDNASGAIGTTQFDQFGLVSAMYLVKSDTTALIVSTIPWDEGTSSIVDTIHVTKLI
jgi:hypothetical protein